MCTLESFKLPGEEERQLLICRIRSGSEPVLVKINTTVGEEQVKEKEVFFYLFTQFKRNIICAVTAFYYNPSVSCAVSVIVF